MENTLLQFFKSNNIATSARTLVAVSGGVDSVVLATLFYKAKLPFAMAHCNFKLRGKESDEDEQFVKQLAAGWGVPCYTTSFDTQVYAHAQGISIQMAARNLRYGWFEQLRAGKGFDFIATAHHQGDVAETILFNLVKGTGLDGLSGIASKTTTLIRPLHTTASEKIKTFAQAHHIAWRTDSSNASTKYGRNKIRHRVLPELNQLNPKATEAIARSGKRVAEANLFLNHSLQQIWPALVVQEGIHTRINLHVLTSIPGHTYVLFLLLKSKGFTYGLVESICNSINMGQSGKLFYAPGYVANIDRKTLLVSPQLDTLKTLHVPAPDEHLEVDGMQITTRTFPASNYKISADPHVLALDKDKLSFPLVIRGWQQGDSFVPLGMRGKKKLSDFMIDVKIPVNLKKQVRVVVSGNEIAGVLNHRPDNRFKITQATQTVFEIKCKN